MSEKNLEVENLLNKVRKALEIVDNDEKKENRTEKRGRKKGDTGEKFCKKRYKLSIFDYKKKAFEEHGEYSTLNDISNYIGLEYNTINYIYRKKNQNLCKMFEINDI
jgi:hypothetical protein